jgi:hypothetical protein
LRWRDSKKFQYVQKNWTYWQFYGLFLPVNVLEELRRRVDRDVFDYRQLMDCLGEYSKPRDKTGSLLASGAIVRVKKGLYVFGEAWRRGPIGREFLANLIYGPSCVSLEYALSHHGLIPERVAAVTSVTTGKARRFETPFGLFTYRPVPPAPYALGLTLAEAGRDRFRIASPEKALADFVWADRRFRPGRVEDCAAYLQDDLRIAPEGLAALNVRAFDEIVRCYGTPRLVLLAAYLRNTRRKPR